MVRAFPARIVPLRAPAPVSVLARCAFGGVVMSRGSYRGGSTSVGWNANRYVSPSLTGRTRKGKAVEGLKKVLRVLAG